MASEDQTAIPFLCVTRKEDEMTCWDISPVKKTWRCQESYSICRCNWKLECEGGREREKQEGCEGVTVDSNQMVTEAKPCHMARGFLDLLCLETKALHLLLHSIHTCLKSAHWTPAQSLSQLIYLPVFYFLKLEDEGKLGEEYKWLMKRKTITHIHQLSSCIQSGPIFYQKEGCSGLEKLV